MSQVISQGPPKENEAVCESTSISCSSPLTSSILFTATYEPFYLYLTVLGDAEVSQVLSKGPQNGSYGCNLPYNWRNMTGS